MRRASVAAAITALLGTSAVVGAALGNVGSPQPATFDATLYVATGGGHGSGVHIGGGFIITSAHVVDDAKVVSVKRTDGKIAAARVVWTSKEYDIAALQTDLDIPAAELSCDALRQGDDVQAIGSPLSFEFVSSYGKIAGDPRALMDIKSVYVTNIATVMGQSGGPLFHDGKVVAINTAVMLAPLKNGVVFVPTMTGFGFAVPSTVVCELMGRSVVKP